MNRFDWMKVLTKGYPPPKLKQKGKPPGIAEKGESSKEHFISQVERDSTNQTDPIDAIPDSTSQMPNEKKKRNTKEKLAQIRQEKINQLRNRMNIHVNGVDIPPPLETFDQLCSDYDVSSRVVENLLSERYVTPTPIQMQTWPLLLRRRELLASAPTGSGKTAAFLLPVIHHLKAPTTKGFRAIVLAPTRELAKQIVRESDRLTDGTGLKTSIISKVKGAVFAKFFKTFDILVTTPNRLIYLMQENEAVAQLMTRVSWLIVDESDKLFEDGKKGFRDQLASIFVACSGPGLVRAMFSATFSFDVEEWCKVNLNDPVTVSIGMRNTCPDVDQSLSFCASNAGKLMEIMNILRKGYEIPCLIFVQTKERATHLCHEILLTGRPVQCIHSDMSQAKRDTIVREFREKKIWILVCTELMGRGIDFKGVNLVINFDFPPSIVSYIHRIGRTGRAGRRGKAITFWSLEDAPLLRSIGQVMKSSGSEVPDWILDLKNTSTRERKRFAKMMPDRGNLLRDAVKNHKWEGKKRKRPAPKGVENGAPQAGTPKQGADEGTEEEQI